MATRSNVPLPPGFEAKWDPGQGAYFYINHVTKKTSWEDPRISHHAGANRALNQYGLNVPQKREAIPMSDISPQRRHSSGRNNREETHFIQADPVLVKKLFLMYKDCSESVIRDIVIRNQNDFDRSAADLTRKGYAKHHTKIHVETRETVIIKLQKKFPGAITIIPDILSECGNNEADAIKQLNILGFGSPRSRSPSPRPTASHRSSHKSKQPSASPARQPSPQRNAAPERPSMSLAQKEQLKKKFEREYNHIGEYLVRMALEACEYDEASTKAVLDTGLEEFRSESESSRPSTAGSSRPSTTDTNRCMTSDTPVISANLEPVALDIGDDLMPAKPGSARSKNLQSSIGRQQQKAKNVTKMSEQLLTTTNDMLNHLSSTCCPIDNDYYERTKKHVKTDPVVTQPKISQSRPTGSTKPTTIVAPKAKPTGPRQSVTHSEHRIQPVGPDPTLCNGPDPSLHGCYEKLAAGPDPTLRQGADSERHFGSQGWIGPDLSLRCGPMLQTTRIHGKGLLVTNF